MDDYSQHPSIIKIKESTTVTETFDFGNLNSDDIKKEIKELNKKTTTALDDIPAKILIDSCEVTSTCLANIYQKSKYMSIFPNSLKLANVTPIHTKKQRTNKENYRPICVLPTVSILFERNMYNEIHFI